MIKCDCCEDKIFVFGSNLAGRHGKGAALHAMSGHGAEYGQGWGLQGRSFAIPTKDANLKTLSLTLINEYVNVFRLYANFSQEKFFVTKIGCGLAGYKDEDIAPMFRGCSSNIELHEDWKKIIESIGK